MTATITRPRSTKKYHALRALGYSDEAALAALESIGVIKSEPEVDPVVAQLIASGEFTKEEAEALVVRLAPEEAAKPPVLTPKEQAEALVADSLYEFTKGRVYLNGSCLEAGARVLKTGTPEIVTTSGVGHIAAVLVYREESGDVAIQNLKN